MILGKPAPSVSAFVAAVDEAMRAHHPSHALSVTPRVGLAFCVTAVLVTNAMCWQPCPGCCATARCPGTPCAWLGCESSGGTLASPRVPWSSTIPTSRAPPRPRRLPISLNDATRTAGAIWGDTASSFSSWSPPQSPCPWTLSSLRQPRRSVHGTNRQRGSSNQVSPTNRGPQNRHPMPSLPPNSHSPCACWGVQGPTSRHPGAR